MLCSIVIPQANDETMQRQMHYAVPQSAHTMIIQFRPGAHGVGMRQKIEWQFERQKFDAFDTRLAR
jgi:hypothetical protein